MRDIVLSLPADDADTRDGLELLRAWDGRVDAESPAACIFELFVAEMCVRVAKAKAPRERRAAIGEYGLGRVSHNLFTDRRVAHLVRLFANSRQDGSRRGRRNCRPRFREVVQKLRRKVGPGPAYWGWGHLRQLRLEHPLFGKHRWLGAIFNLGPSPSAATATRESGRRAAADSRLISPTTCATCERSSTWLIWERVRFVLCGGQSGNPLSNHYDDQLPLWREGEKHRDPLAAR